MTNRLSLLNGLLFSVVALLSACAKSGGRPLSELMPADTKNQYIVHAGDTLMVNIWGEPKLSGEVLVREDGQFSLPLIDDIQAEGKGLKQISADISAKLKRFISETSVSVSVVQSAPIRYFLSGSFTKPGEYRSDKKITLLQAIATGGGFAPFADESDITLIRRGSEGEMRYALDYNRVVDGREPNPELKNGDIVAVK